MRGRCLPKNCLTCGSEFRACRKSQRFCSKSCVRGAGSTAGICCICDTPFVGKSHRRCCSKTCGKRIAWLWKKYRLTPEGYKVLKMHQNGLCAICKVEPATDIDHNHSTSQVRELLCSGCNCGLGNFGEDIARLEQAIEYLRKHYAR